MTLRSLAASGALSLLAACALAQNSPAPAAAGSAPAAPVIPASGAPAMTLPTDADTAPAAGAPKTTYSQCHVEGQFVALTFDDGPHGENTPRLLDMLKARHIKATFFVVGQCAQEFPQIMKRIVAEGHEVANHSWSHPQLTKMAEGSVTEQLQKTHDVILQTTGVAPKVLRPPYGAFTANQRSWANAKWGYKTILWDVDPLDWKVRNAEHVKTEILRHTVAGSIILSHDIHKSTVDAMPDVIDGLIGRGFQFVTVSELVAMDKPLTPKPKATPKPTDVTGTAPEAAKPVAEAPSAAKKAKSPR